MLLDLTLERRMVARDPDWRSPCSDAYRLLSNTTGCPAHMLDAVAPALGGLLDLSLAWNLTKEEFKAARVRPPFELELRRRYADEWLAGLAGRVDNGDFAPKAMEIVEVPKARGLVRPIAYLVPEDRVVYTALVAACFPAIRAALNWSQGSKDFAYQLSPKFPPGDWFHDRFKGWNNFRRATLINIDTRGGAVAFTDVSAFYEHVDIRTLLGDLRRVEAPPPVVALLATCLRRWAPLPGRGLPQHIDASHVLAKLYLDMVDRALSNAGILHVRYSDDMRLFLNNEEEAQRALVYLARILRRRGLALQSAKSVIDDAQSARSRAQGLAPVLRTVQRAWIEQMLKFMGVDEDDPYPTRGEVDSALADNPDEAPIEVIREAFRRYFLSRDRPPFDKTLFRYLLKRLGLAQDRIAFRYVTTFLGRHPEETSELLRYVERLDAVADAEPALTRFLRSRQGNVYPHQTYQVFRWIDRVSPESISSLLPVIRRNAFNASTTRYVRAAARALLGRYGDPADLERIRSLYDETSDPLERAQIVCSLSAMEKGIRNEFFAQVRDDDPLVSLAVDWSSRADRRAAREGT